MCVSLGDDDDDDDDEMKKGSQSLLERRTKHVQNKPWNQLRPETTRVAVDLLVDFCTFVVCVVVGDMLCDICLQYII